MFEFSPEIECSNLHLPSLQFNTISQPRLAILALLRCVAHDFACHFGIKCSSFSKVNVGTSRRSACDSIGCCDYQSVRAGNILLERTDFERSDHFHFGHFNMSTNGVRILNSFVP